MPDDLNDPGAPSLERKLATILSADVAEFSRLMGEDEEQTLRTFRGHKEIFESLVATHRGRIFNTAGDAILAEFGSAVEAVRCATEIQAALRTRNDQLPASRQVKFRIGINLGDVMVQGQDLLGDGVNVAARLQTAAEPGGICLSGSVHDQIRNKLSLSFQSLGERNYKNIQQPVRTFSITDAEEHGSLPSPKAGGAGGRPAVWIAAGVLALLVAGGGYWAYVNRERGKVEPAPATTVAAQPSATQSEAVKPGVEKPAAEQPQTTTSPAQSAREPETRTAEASREPKLHAPKPQNASAAAASAPSAGPYDGVYSGPVCYGQGPKLPGGCYPAKGTISGNNITGQWPMHHEAGVTMFLAGDVGNSGDIRIQMHTEKADSSRGVTINLEGTVHNGKLSAQGHFLNGRDARLDWYKDVSH
jgi:class 3 adenylate cyclase